jgi:hypothetical protein
MYHLINQLSRFRSNIDAPSEELSPLNRSQPDLSRVQSRTITQAIGRRVPEVTQ